MVLLASASKQCLTRPGPDLFCYITQLTINGHAKVPSSQKDVKIDRTKSFRDRALSGQQYHSCFTSIGHVVK